MDGYIGRLTREVRDILGRSVEFLGRDTRTQNIVYSDRNGAVHIFSDAMGKPQYVATLNEKAA